MPPLVTVEKIVLGGLASRRVNRKAAGTLPAGAGHRANPVSAALDFDCYVAPVFVLRVGSRDGFGTLWGNHGPAASLHPRFAQYRDFFEQLDVATPVGRAGERP
jgi:hypothetical protein